MINESFEMSVDEESQTRRAFFEEVDTDEDGYVTLLEVSEYLSNLPIGTSSPYVELLQEAIEVGGIENPEDKRLSLEGFLDY